MLAQVTMSGKELQEKNSKSNKLAALFFNRGSNKVLNLNKCLEIVLKNLCCVQNLTGESIAGENFRTLYNLVIFLARCSLDTVSMDMK